MRISASMLRGLSAGIFALAIILAAIAPALALDDTGTYSIPGYTVTLEPQSSGQVRITIEQQWKVLGGDIPWITVGLPNDKFAIESFSGAASAVKINNGNGFTGVRIELDRDYTAGQTFNIKFSVLQDNLLERLTAEKKWRINYTPGRYDNAEIAYLRVNLVSPVDYQTYSSLSPQPTSVADNILSWEWLNLSPGSGLNINIVCLDGRFLSATTQISSQSNGVSIKTLIVIVIVILVVGGLVFWGIRKNRQNRDAELKNRIASLEEELAKDKQKKAEVEAGFEKYVEDKNLQPDAQGRYYDKSYGNYITPVLWAAVISHQYGGQQNLAPGTASKPGCVSSCACACVSCACACACACAGGGAAGCSRKSLHECRDCNSTRTSSSS
jgi:hypothetical protein